MAGCPSNIAGVFLRRGDQDPDIYREGFAGDSDGKECGCHAEDHGLVPGWKDSLEGMATHSSVQAWRIPMDRGAWGAATVHGVVKSWT